MYRARTKTRSFQTGVAQQHRTIAAILIMIQQDPGVTQLIQTPDMKRVTFRSVLSILVGVLSRSVMLVEDT